MVVLYRRLAANRFWTRGFGQSLRSYNYRKEKNLGPLRTNSYIYKILVWTRPYRTVFRAGPIRKTPSIEEIFDEAPPTTEGGTSEDIVCFF